MIVFGVLGSSFNEQELLDKHTLSRQVLQEIVEYLNVQFIIIGVK